MNGHWLSHNRKRSLHGEEKREPVAGNSAIHHSDHRSQALLQEKLLNAIAYNGIDKPKININNDQALEKEADQMGEKSLQFSGKNNLQFRQIHTDSVVAQLRPSEKLLEKKRFIENRIGIILDSGPNPTRLRLLQFDEEELAAMREPDEDGRQLLTGLLQKVRHFIGLVEPEAGLHPHTIVERNNFERLKEIFIAGKPPIPTQQEYSGPDGAKRYAARLGEFHAALNTAAAPLRFKILARFFVEGEGEHIIHPGLNSWARFNAFKPHDPRQPVPISAAEIRNLAKQHMTLGHDTGDDSTDVIKNSPLFSGTEDLGKLIMADSPFATSRLAGLTEMPVAKGPARKAAASSSSSLLGGLHKKPAAVASPTATAGKGASDRIIKLIWGFDSFFHARNMNSRSPVAVANRLIFIAIPSNYPHLYTPEQIDAAQSECCVLERENTVFAQLTNIKSLAIGSLPNYFPFMQIYTDTFRISQRSEYIELMRSGILHPNSVVNIARMEKAEREKFIADLEKKIDEQKRKMKPQ